MEIMMLSVLSVILFCFCCYQLMKSATVTVPLFNHGYYSKSALRIAKGYKVLAWSVMTAFFLVSLVMSFYQVFTQL